MIETGLHIAKRRNAGIIRNNKLWEEIGGAVRIGGRGLFKKLHH